MDRKLQHLIADLSDLTRQEEGTGIYVSAALNELFPVREAARPSRRNRQQYQDWLMEKWDSGFGVMPPHERDKIDWDRYIGPDDLGDTEPMTQEELEERKRIKEEFLREKKKEEKKRQRRIGLLTKTVKSSLSNAFATSVDVRDNEFSRDNKVELIVRHRSGLDIMFSIILEEGEVRIKTKAHPKRYIDQVGQTPPSSFMRSLSDREKMTFGTAEEFDEVLRRIPSAAKMMVGNALNELEAISR